jgi:hypothetical protein
MKDVCNQNHFQGNKEGVCNRIHSQGSKESGRP